MNTSRPISFCGALLMAYCVLAQAPDYGVVRNRPFANVKQSPYFAYGDGVHDDTAAINAAKAQNLNIYFPPGTYVISSALTLSANGQHISCAGSGYQSTSPALLRFTGATDGFQLGNANNVEIDDCMIQTTNASAGKAINVTTTTGAGHKLIRLAFFNGAGGAWKYGIFFSGAIGSVIDQPYCFSIARCISFNAQANGNDVRQPLIGGTGVNAIEVLGSTSINVWGGVDEGSYALLASVDVSSSATFDGMYWESSGSQANLLNSQGQTTVRNVQLGGGSVTGAALLFTGASSATIDGLYGFISTPGCMIEADGNASNTAHSFVVQNMQAFNASAVSGSHSVCIGTSTTGWWSALVTGSYLQSHDTAVVAKGGGLVTLGPGNAFNSSGFGVDATGVNLIKIDGNNFPAVSAPCNGCKLNNVLFPSNNVLNNTQQFSLPGGSPIISDLPSCNQFVSNILGYWVTDSNTATWGAAVAGSGSNVVSVICNHAGGGTGSWTVYGK